MGQLIRSEIGVMIFWPGISAVLMPGTKHAADRPSRARLVSSGLLYHITLLLFGTVPSSFAVL